MRAERVLDVAGHRGRVAVVDARERAPDHHVLRRVVGAQQRGGRAHGLGPEARARAVRGAGVPGDPEERDVDALGRLDVRQPPERARAAVARGLRASTGSYIGGGYSADRASADEQAGEVGARELEDHAAPAAVERDALAREPVRDGVHRQRGLRPERARCRRSDTRSGAGRRARRRAPPSASPRARARPRSESSRSPGTSANAKPSSSSATSVFATIAGVQPERLGRVRGPLDAVLVAVLGELARRTRAGIACRA